MLQSGVPPRLVDFPVLADTMLVLSTSVLGRRTIARHGDNKAIPGLLEARESFVLNLEVAIPTTATHEMSDTTTVTASSVFDPEVWESAQAVTTVPPPRRLFLPVVLRNSS